MPLYTVIVGNAFPEVADDTAYLVEAVNAEYAMVQAEAIATGHRGGPQTTYYCMDGQVVFHRKSPHHQPVTVIDLRAPDPETVAVACVGAEDQKIVAALADVPGAMFLPGGKDGYRFFVKPPSWTREQMEDLIKKAMGRTNFTMSWTTLSKAT
jgi:hypothetical protein